MDTATTPTRLFGVVITSSLTGFAIGAATIWWWLSRHRRPVVVAVNPNSEEEEDDDDDNNDDDDGTSARGEYKMVLIVNESLKMGKGKIAAQCCHACLGTFQRAGKKEKKAWARSGQAKIALKVPETENLLLIEDIAKAAGLPCYLVADAGRTQIAAGSLTVLGIGPARVSDIDEVTASLKLL